jgi:septal ring-binding cell division protein DamX
VSAQGVVTEAVVRTSKPTRQRAGKAATPVLALEYAPSSGPKPAKTKAKVAERVKPTQPKRLDPANDPEADGVNPYHRGMGSMDARRLVLRKRLRDSHPDRGGDIETFQAYVAEYDLVKELLARMTADVD